ncbi:MAG: hypothetical protein B7Y41_07620 [Hydrogenophilales bacterium 28-61-23]|nr:MAG: hypothetical protein B7Y41_07620 [Hydrogenophilales bacterium 28-61-23]
MARVIFIFLSLFLPTCSLAAKPTNIDYTFLDISFKEFLNRVSHDKVVVEDGCCWLIYSKGIHIMTIGDKNSLNDKIVKSIDIYSPTYNVLRHTRVGMSAAEIIKTYPNSVLDYDDEDGYEYFAPKSLQKFTNSGGFYICVLLTVADGSSTVNLDPTYPSRRFRHNAKTIAISIYKFSM